MAKKSTIKEKKERIVPARKSDDPRKHCWYCGSAQLQPREDGVLVCQKCKATWNPVRGQ